MTSPRDIGPRRPGSSWHQGGVIETPADKPVRDAPGILRRSDRTTASTLQGRVRKPAPIRPRDGRLEMATFALRDRAVPRMGRSGAYGPTQRRLEMALL